MKKSLKVAQIFSDNMVLQRNKSIVVWGEARKNADITVSLNGYNIKTNTIEYEWSVEIPKMDAGGPYTMTISDGQEEIVFENVMVGEVWLAGGQSNMEMELQNSLNGFSEANKAKNDLIRFYNTAKIATLEDEKSLKEEAKSHWQVVSPQTAGSMSAVAYYFAKEVQEKLGIAVGIIDCYWGASSICCWVGNECIESDLNVHIYSEEWAELVGDKSIEEYEREVERFDKELSEWGDKAEQLRAEDPNITMWNIIDKIGNCPWEPPFGYKSPYRPSGLYHTMIKRVAPYTIKGVLWYQGEQDASKAEIYDIMLQNLIGQWRKEWKDESLPFYIVQLPMWIAMGAEDDKSWAVIRDKQRKVTDTIKNTYLTVLVDCGEFDNIHPLNKKVVGHRLALQALKYSYEYKELYVDGPKYLQRDLNNGKIVLYFEHVYGGFKVIDNQKIRLFEVAGSDREFYEADAEIIGNTIVVSNEKVKNPKYARYAWTNYGIVNLFNAEGFPVAPFATM